ncbi:hypothetical protein QN277_005990 [Acacia crassicarpa]|uniref:Uncharacterized protein n=1 Tax=Acacia crassicarpa TaxID=499986 RepID=A0AAE1IZE4_9FABA|nr:hypothetical protein QN277_005990 [Acacia crassicarpa]
MFSSSSSSGGGGFGGGGGGGGGSGGGCGSGSNGGNGNSPGVLSSGMKKQQKHPKIPKRGPGVAELEKILRDDEKSKGGININNINTTSSNNNNNNVEGFSVSHPFLNPRRRSPPPPSPRTSRPLSPSHHIPIAPRFDHLNPPPPGLYGYNTAKQQQGRNFPEQPLFPMNPSSCDVLSQPDSDRQHFHHTANSSAAKNFYSESSSNHHHHHLWPSYPALPQERHCTNNQYSSSMVKQILGPRAPPPSSSSLTTGHFNHEPPSSQSPYFSGTSARNPTEEPKMVGMRPHRSSSFENSLVPSSNFQVPPFSPNLITRPHNKSSSNNDIHISTSNFTSSNNDWDVKWGSTLGLNSNRSRFGSEISTGGSGNFSSLINGGAAAPAPIPTPPVPSPSLHMFQRELSNNDNYQVPQERVEDSNQKSESSIGGSDRQRRFYNFLEVKEVEDMKETTLGSNHEGSEAGSSGLDLTLKL